VTKIVASDAASNDNFGWSVAISGDYAIVGATGNDNYAGTAYIFRRTNTNAWDNGTKIVAPQNASIFGYTVSISGDYAIVGAAGGDGSVYIFRRTNTNTWDNGTKLVASGIGYSVGISGDYAIVGAYGNDNFTGTAYIFRRTGTNTWDDRTDIVASDPASGDNFGWSVAISGDYAVVGAYGNDDNGGDSGSAYTFLRTDTNTWDIVTKIVASDAAGGDNFGFSVDISGDYATVGANGNDDNGGNSGSAYIFDLT